MTHISILGHLQNLYYNGEWRGCMESLNLFLLANATNTEALLLKGKCQFELAKQENAGAAFLSAITVALDTFEHILTIDPCHTGALLSAAYIRIFILRDNISQAIGYCDTLLQEKDLSIQARADDYKVEANFITFFEKDELTETEVWEGLHHNELFA